MQDFRNLKVWQKSHPLAVELYKVTENFPGSEIYGLTAQIRRTCTSIPANIAEGCGRSGDAEFGRFLTIAMGSACELEYHLLLSRDLKFLKNSDYQKLDKGTVEIKQMLATLIKKLKADGRKLKAEND